MAYSETILAALVIYNIKLNDCITYQSFIKYRRSSKFDIRLIILDNSEIYSTELMNQNEFLYIHSGNKNMLAGAYNEALGIANKNQYKWLMLLDQDSRLTKEYFDALNIFFENRSSAQSNIAAIVPCLVNENSILSPHKLYKYIWLDKEINNLGVQDGHVIAFNSLSLLDVSFLNQINGFNLKYPLDMLDHWLYFQLYKMGKKLFVLNVKIKHQLSVATYSDSVTLKRHKILLEAERNITKELGFGYYLTYKFRLFFRLIKQFVSIKDKAYAFIIFKTLIGLK